MVGTWRDVWPVMNSNRQQRATCNISSANQVSQHRRTWPLAFHVARHWNKIPPISNDQKSSNCDERRPCMVARITKAFQSACGGGTIDGRLQRFSHFHSADIEGPCRMTATMKFHEHVYLMKQLFLQLISSFVCFKLSIISFQRDAECANVWFRFDEPRDLTSSSQPVICRSKDWPVFFIKGIISIERLENARRCRNMAHNGDAIFVSSGLTLRRPAVQEPSPLKTICWRASAHRTFPCCQFFP